MIAEFARNWLLPQVMRGHANWCGRFLTIAAPRHVSQWFGHGTQGLRLFSWTEHGHDIIKRDRADRRARGLK